MKLHSGVEVEILGQIQVDNKPHAIVKLPNTRYISGALVTLILLPMSEFQEHIAQRSAESIKAEPHVTVS